MERLTSTMFLVALAHAAAAGCGGESLRHVDSDDRGEIGGASPTGGGTGGAAGTSGNGATAGTTGSRGRPIDCFLAVDPGTCDGAIGRWAFHPMTGLCVPFNYGGCEGNPNNFATIESCYARCATDAPSAAACSTPLDCTLMQADCCGCEQRTLGNTVAVNVNQTDAVYQAMGCHLVDCMGCEAIAPNPWLGATCTNGQCIAFDSRQSELTACMKDEDCYLRAGLGCCEACSAVPFVAVSNLVDPRPLLCGNSAVACDACEPTPPEGLVASCNAGRCGLELDR